MRARSESRRADDGPPGASAGARRAWMETLFVTLLAPAIGWAWNAQDPFFLQARVPWIVLAPLLVGLQHGSTRALACSLGVVAGAYAFARTGHAHAGGSSAAFFAAYSVGLGLVGLLAGEYRDAWQRTRQRFRDQAAERGARLDQLTRAYHLLKRSHDLLEQRLAGGGPSLQAVLDHAREQLESAGDSGLRAAADAVLRLFGDYGQVQVASLHLLREGRAAGEPLAELGKAPALDPEHPMVRDAVAAGTLTSVRQERLAGCGFAPLACVPLVDVDGHVWGLVVVHEMPFLAMHEEHMALLAVLGGRVGDWMAERAKLHRPAAAAGARARLGGGCAPSLGR